jgi:hypothetical protein
VPEGRTDVAYGPGVLTTGRRARIAEDRAARWRFRRVVARVDAVDAVIAEFATSYCGRPFRRRDVGPLESAVDLPGVTWTVEGEVIVELLYADRGPSRLLVHEIALVRPLRKLLRSRHLTVEYVPLVVRRSR